MRVTNYAKDFYNLVGDTNIVRSKSIEEFLSGKGYAERTINNHLRPSHVGGMMNTLVTKNLVQKHGMRLWIVPDMQALLVAANSYKIVKRQPSVKYFIGMPKTDGDWKHLRILSDPSDKVQWHLYGENYEKKSYNLKVSSDGSVAHKANFWLQGRNGSVNQTKDAVLLKTHHPQIYENLCEDFKEICE